MIKRTSPIIIGNWKSTPKTIDEGQKFIKTLEKKIASMKIKFPKKGYYLATPEIFIPSLSLLAKHGYIGAQTIPGIANPDGKKASRYSNLCCLPASGTGCPCRYIPCLFPI